MSSCCFLSGSFLWHTLLLNRRKAGQAASVQAENHFWEAVGFSAAVHYLLLSALKDDRCWSSILPSPSCFDISTGGKEDKILKSLLVLVQR